MGKTTKKKTTPINPEQALSWSRRAMILSRIELSASPNINLKSGFLVVEFEREKKRKLNSLESHPLEKTTNIIGGCIC